MVENVGDPITHRYDARHMAERERGAWTFHEVGRFAVLAAAPHPVSSLRRRASLSPPSGARGNKACGILRKVQPCCPSPASSGRGGERRVRVRVGARTRSMRIRAGQVFENRGHTFGFRFDELRLRRSTIEGGRPSCRSCHTTAARRRRPSRRDGGGPIDGASRRRAAGPLAPTPAGSAPSRRTGAGGWRVHRLHV
jgi:hypothetical protein